MLPSCRRLVLLAVLLSVPLLAGCNKEKTTKPVVPDLYVAQDSPANCLANLEQAYVDRDPEQYVKLFASDFAFVFCPDDVENPTNPTPAQWGLAEETTAHSHMFRDSLVDKIELAFQQSQAVDSGMIYAGTYRVYLTLVNLRVYTRKQDGTPWEYRVPNGTATFYFKEYPEEEARNGQPLWRIWRWEDQPLGGGALARAPFLTQDTRWGRVKANYFQ